MIQLKRGSLALLRQAFIMHSKSMVLRQLQILGKTWNIQKMTFIQPMLECDSFLEAFTQKIWEIYGSLTAFQLSELTHKPGTPWYKIWFENGGSKRKGVDIPDALIFKNISRID